MMIAKPDMPDIPKHTLLLICDGARALIARNRGTVAHVQIEVLSTQEAPQNPPNFQQGHDRPGRVVTSGGTRRSAVEVADPHKNAEQAFLEQCAETFRQLAGETPAVPLAVIAPPPALATLRKALDGLAPRHAVTWIAKDLTNHPSKDIDKLLSQPPGN